MKIITANSKPETRDFEASTIVIKYGGSEYIINEREGCLQVRKDNIILCFKHDENNNSLNFW